MWQVALWTECASGVLSEHRILLCEHNIGCHTGSNPSSVGHDKAAKYVKYLHIGYSTEISFKVLQTFLEALELLNR